MPIEMAALSKPLPIPLATMPREYLAEEMILWGHCGVYRMSHDWSMSARAIYKGLRLCPVECRLRIDKVKFHTLPISPWSAFVYDKLLCAAL